MHDALVTKDVPRRDPDGSSLLAIGEAAASGDRHTRRPTSAPVREPGTSCSALSVRAPKSCWTRVGPLLQWSRDGGARAGLVPSVAPTSSPAFVPFASVYQVAFGGPTDRYALVHKGGHLGIARTTDGGRVWALVPGAPDFGVPATAEVLSGR